ncbi:alpha/beta hydrolase [Sphingobium sp. C100]|uniref:alpha/beta hydrolase n=1 Tax=Sphingobium sp. C100 TaxID=1207055 RepID=UPI0003FF2B58|nr:alpha/beta hydrolase [Sphingobium sp. C100]
MNGLDRRSLMLGGGLLAGTGVRGLAQPPALDVGAVKPDAMINLWPGDPPGTPTLLPQEAVQDRSRDPAAPDRALLHIARPRLALFRAHRPNGAAMLVMPGGGYNYVVIDKEGYEIGPWLAARGVSVFVLFYRLPQEGWGAGADVALSDAQRAMRLIRHRAPTLAIDSRRVGAMGFSAGGHVCADLATRFATATYHSVDAADALSARPAIAAPIYPVVSMHRPEAHEGSRRNLIGESPTAAMERRHSPHENVGSDSPPCFLVHAEDDSAVPIANSLLLRAAWRAEGLAVESHFFAEGGHGFGLKRASGKPAAIWPELFLHWMAAQRMTGNG